MRATFALGGDEGLQSDPALEPSQAGRAVIDRYLDGYSFAEIGR